MPAHSCCSEISGYAKKTLSASVPLHLLAIIAYATFIVLFLLLLSPDFHDVLLRLNPRAGYPREYATLLTACLLCIGQNVQIWPLRNAVAVYIGDVSYVLYLVHWPVICYVRYWSLEPIRSLRGTGFSASGFGMELS